MASYKKVVLVKSLIGSTPEQKATASSIGLRKIGESAILPDNLDTVGKIKILDRLVVTKPVRGEEGNG